MIELSPPTAWREGVIHSAYVRIALAMAERLGLSVTLRLPEAGRMLSLLDVLPLLERLAAADTPALGIDLGSLIPASAHGAMGYAVVSSPTVGDALHTLAHYASMRNRFFHYRCQSQGDETRLILEPRMPLGAFQTFCEIGTSVSLFKMIQHLAGNEAAAHMQFHARWPDAMPLDVPMQMHYNAPCTLLVVPHDMARKVTPTADAKLFGSACRSCEEELAALEGSLASRLRAMMPNAENQWPSLKESAARLAMSPRTLMRHLAAEGVSFQTLQDDAKSELASWYLTHTPLPVSTIAERTGFMDDTNFSRSFRRWRNITPLAYRQATRRTP